MSNRDRKKKPTPGTIVAIVVVLAIAAPELFGVLLVLALIAAIFVGPFLIVRYVRKHSSDPSPKQPAAGRQRFPLDDCPKPLCFHKDKGEHHVRKGKDIDPWDRPDIDISKYQRK